jgi:lactam utilization protein B
MLADNEILARAVISAITSLARDWVLYWPTPLERHRFYELAQQEGLTIVLKLAVDLHYRSDGSLVLECVKQVWDPGEVADRIERFVRSGKIGTVDEVDLEFDVKSAPFAWRRAECCRHRKSCPRQVG